MRDAFIDEAGRRGWLLTIAGVGHTRVVAVDAGTSTDHVLRGVYMGGGHRAVVAVGDTLDVLDRIVEKGNSDGGRCGC